jgi:hypothetical protein
MEQPKPAGSQFDAGTPGGSNAEVVRVKKHKSSVGHLFMQQVIINFVVVGVLIAVGAFLVFKVQGEAYTQFTAACFIAVCYFSFIVFLPAGTLFACRAEVAKGHVAISEDEKTGATQPMANPVSETIPTGIALAAVCSAIICLFIYGTGWTPSPVAVTVLSLLFVFPYAIIVRRNVFRDVEGLLKTGPMRGDKPASRMSHIWMNYLLPNLVFQAIINMPLADRGFSNIAALIADRVGPGMVPVAALVPDFAITFMFVCNFTFLAVVVHTASDMYQGRLRYTGKGHGINGLLYFAVMLLMGLALGAAVAGAAHVSGIALLSFPVAMALKFLVVLLSVYLACRLGVGWTGKKFNTAVAKSMRASVQMA